MNGILKYLESAVNGLGRYLDANKTMVLFGTVLLALWLAEEKKAGEKANRILVYALVLTVLLICPVSAIFVMFYQTAFYDYEWAFSLVPVTAVIAYGMTEFVTQKVDSGKKILITVMAVLLILLSGNFGRLQKLPQEQKTARADVAEIMQSIYIMEPEDTCVLWGPKDVMQQMRRKNGEICLIYGKDMWDGKSGSYDYEAYSPELTKAYEWLEKAVVYNEFADTMENPSQALAMFFEQYELEQDTISSLEVVLQSGANTLVLPGTLAEQVKKQLEETALKEQKTVESVFTEDYTIYMVK